MNRSLLEKYTEQVDPKNLLNALSAKYPKYTAGENFKKEELDVMDIEELEELIIEGIIKTLEHTAILTLILKNEEHRDPVTLMDIPNLMRVLVILHPSEFGLLESTYAKATENCVPPHIDDIVPTIGRNIDSLIFVNEPHIKVSWVRSNPPTKLSPDLQIELIQ